jgi:hypothetical protein
MAQARGKKLAIVVVALLLIGIVAVVVQRSIQRQSAVGNSETARETKASPTAQATATATATAPAPAGDASAKVLVFRNIPSWNRSPDFEDTLADLGLDFEVKPSSLMSTADLSLYRFVVIPGAQWKTDFYQTYAANAERFDRYVTNGGVLVLELNGAENDGIPLPRGVNIMRHGSKENAVLFPEHPILVPLAGKPIRANYASHCYLTEIPSDALVLAAEATDGQSDATRPTFIEYAVGAGRVIAACQCFHDQDRSGRGPLMGTVLNYAAARKWYSAKP